MPTPLSRREEILQAAITVFSTRGFGACLVDDIAREAGVAKGTLYLYFKSKHEMYLEAFRNKIEQLHELSQLRMEEASSTWAKIEAFVAARLEFSEMEEDFLRIYLSEFATKLDDQDQWAQELREVIRKESRSLEKVVEEGIERGEIRELPASQVVTILQYTVAGIVAGRLSGFWQPKSHPQPDLIIDLLQRGLVPVSG